MPYIEIGIDDPINITTEFLVVMSSIEQKRSNESLLGPFLKLRGLL